MAGTSWRRPSRRVRAIAAFVVLLLLGAVPVARAVSPPALTKYPGGTWQPPKATYGTSLESGKQVRMDDGAVLIVDVVYRRTPRRESGLPDRSRCC